MRTSLQDEPDPSESFVIENTCRSCDNMHKPERLDMPETTNVKYRKFKSIQVDLFLINSNNVNMQSF